MRLILIGFHLYLILVPAALSAQNVRLQALDYAVYIGGLRAVNIDLDISLGKRDYDIKLVLNTEGLVDKLFKWSMTAFSYGDVKKGVVMPRKASRSSIWQGKRRSVSLNYSSNGFPNVVLEPNTKKFNQTSQPSKNLAGARDLAGAILSYLTFAGNQNTCVRSEPIFDGKRYYKLLFENQTSVRLRRDQYSPYRGPALRCQFRLQKISGFRSNEPRYTWMAGASAWIWLAPVFSRAVMVPVRIETDTTFGGLFIHLIAAKRNYKGEENKLVNQILKKIPTN